MGEPDDPWEPDRAYRWINRLLAAISWGVLALFALSVALLVVLAVFWRDWSS
jgi:hypothetical protein